MGLALGLLLLVQASDDRAREIVKRISFPAPEAVKSWTDKGPEYQRVLDVLLKRENWVGAIRTCEERLGPFADSWAIEVKLGEWNGTHVGKGDRFGDRAEVALNMRRLGEYERKLEDYRKQAEELRKQGKRMVWKVPPIRYERILHHELVHVLQGEYKSPGWFHEGFASWIGDDMNYIIAFANLGKPVQSIEVDLSADADDEYARGMAFFKWLESRDGRDGIKKLFKLTAASGGDWKKGLEEVTHLSWEKVVAVEQEWSAEYFKKNTPPK